MACSGICTSRLYSGNGTTSCFSYSHLQRRNGQTKSYVRDRDRRASRRPARHTTNARSRSQTIREPSQEMNMSFAPCTVANLGVGYDIMGAAAQGQGDVVQAKVISRNGHDGQIIVEEMVGDGGRLSLVADENCCGIAARETLKLIAGLDSGYEEEMASESCLAPDLAISLRCLKGLPLGSGLGSSAASAAAAAWAVNGLFGHPLTRRDLVPAGLISEAAVSGYHADNIAPALMGGFVLIETYKPKLILHQLQTHESICGNGVGEEGGLWFGLVTPVFEAPTREMRAALPAEISMGEFISNSAGAATLCSALITGDYETAGRALGSDIVVEPRRGPLIPGFSNAKEAAVNSGAYGCTISGAGPTLVSVSDNKRDSISAVEAMCNALKDFHDIGCAVVCRADSEGARDVEEWAVPKGDALFIHSF